MSARLRLKVTAERPCTREWHVRSCRNTADDELAVDSKTRQAGSR
jgi:hypothetical protein